MIYNDISYIQLSTSVILKTNLLLCYYQLTNYNPTISDFKFELGDYRNLVLDILFSSNFYSVLHVIHPVKLEEVLKNHATHTL